YFEKCFSERRPKTRFQKTCFGFVSACGAEDHKTGFIQRLLDFDASFNVSGILMIHFSKSKLQRGITNFV
ncbi:MAG: hypothetical protein ACK48D_24090, partial [Pseudanabaena sp.]